MHIIKQLLLCVLDRRKSHSEGETEFEKRKEGEEYTKRENKIQKKKRKIIK